MTPAFEEIPDTIVPCSSDPCADGSAQEWPVAADNFVWQQFRVAGLAAIAEKVTTGLELDLADAIALSRANLPLLGKMVELRTITVDDGEITLEGALPIDRGASLPGLPRSIGQPLTDWQSFCTALIALRDDLTSGGSVNAWYPVLAKPLDHDGQGADDFSGAEVLRAIALARLVLPAEVEIRAPLATLGPKLAQVALDFGASHLGCVALAGQTSDDPLVADATVFDELLESISRTEINAPADPASVGR